LEDADGPALRAAALVFFAAVVFVPVVASARAAPGAADPKSGRVTIIDQAARQAFGRPFGIATIDRIGFAYPLFRWQAARGCYDLESIDWAPDGRRLAFSVTTVAATSNYNLIHILNVGTRSDRHLLWDGFDLDWSPDGKHLAYVEYASFPRPGGTICITGANGAHRTRLRTGTDGSDDSPGGLRFAWLPGGPREAEDSGWVFVGQSSHQLGAM
jgi:hypothetical protein